MAVNTKLTVKTPANKVITSNNVTVTIDWDSGFGQKKTRAFIDAQKYVDLAVLRYNDKYTPKRTGALIASGQIGTDIGSGLVKYTAPYSRRMYYGINYNFNGAPQRGAKWFERMKINHKATILREAAKIIGGTAK